MSLMCHSKAEQTLMETAVLLSHIREVPFEGNSKARFGQLACLQHKYKTSIKQRKAGQKI